MKCREERKEEVYSDLCARNIMRKVLYYFKIYNVWDNYYDRLVKQEFSLREDVCILNVTRNTNYVNFWGKWKKSKNDAHNGKAIVRAFTLSSFHSFLYLY